MTACDWLRARAKEMRAALTPHEKAIWRLLHEGELTALNWRRQAALGEFIVDFVSHPARLVIEVDGAADKGQPQEAVLQTERASPPQSSLRDDSSSIEEERI